MGKITSYPIHISLILTNLLGCLSAFAVASLLLVAHRRVSSEEDALRELVEVGVNGSHVLRDPDADAAREDDRRFLTAVAALVVLCYALALYMVKQVADLLAILLWRRPGGLRWGEPVRRYRDWLGEDYANCLAAHGIVAEVPEADLMFSKEMLLRSAVLGAPYDSGMSSGPEEKDQQEEEEEKKEEEEEEEQTESKLASLKRKTMEMTRSVKTRFDKLRKRKREEEAESNRSDRT